MAEESGLTPDAPVPGLRQSARHPAYTHPVSRPGVTGALVVVVATGAALAVAATLLQPPLERTAGLSIGLSAGMAIYAASVGAFAWARSRDSGDPHALFVVSIGALSLLLVAWWIERHRDPV